MQRALMVVRCFGSLGTLVVGGCAAQTAQQFASITVSNYETASAFSPQGHSVSALPDGNFRITAVGSAATPSARVEKIAMARAAEYGAELKKKAFAVSRTAHSVRCGENYVVQKGERVPIKPADYRVVALDVTYSDKPIEPAIRPTKSVAEALKAELASESVPAEEQASLAAEIAKGCGRTGN